MKIKTTQTTSVTPQAMAYALAHSTPDDFADFWLAFHERVTEKKIDLMPFAEVMIHQQGANRMKPIYNLVALMDFLMVKKSREPVTDK